MFFPCICPSDPPLDPPLDPFLEPHPPGFPRRIIVRRFGLGFLTVCGAMEPPGLGKHSPLLFNIGNSGKANK